MVSPKRQLRQRHRTQHTYWQSSEWHMMLHQLCFYANIFLCYANVTHHEQHNHWAREKKRNSYVAWKENRKTNDIERRKNSLISKSFLASPCTYTRHNYSEWWDKEERSIFGMAIAVVGSAAAAATSITITVHFTCVCVVHVSSFAKWTDDALCIHFGMFWH